MNSMIASFETTAATPAITGVSDASQRNGEPRASCAVCRAKIVDDHWFCRLPQNGNGNVDSESLKILLCSPRCALRHLATLRPRDNGTHSDYEPYERTFQFFREEDKPTWP
jgi:hypothetical protein